MISKGTRLSRAHLGLPSGYKSAWRHWSGILLALMLAATAEADIPDFFNTVFGEYRGEYEALRENEFVRFCAAHELNGEDAANRETFFRLYFLHDLLTTESASDCARGGFLQIPYFWHWVEPNPRHEIISWPDSILLVDQPPYRLYGRYATAADVDRVPELFLGDLVAEGPRYSHPDCGHFYSFGWCSEREMAFTAVAAAWGYEGKIRQEGIHTYSMIWCAFTRSEGPALVLEGMVDNTFGSFVWRKVPATTTLARWREDVGQGANIAWYNKIAHGQEQLHALSEIPVGPEASRRIQGLVGLGIAGGR